MFSASGTIILAISVILWVAMSYPRPSEELLSGAGAARAHELRLSNSAVGRVGRAIEPVLKPLGFDWRIGTALIGATAAKEVFVSQLAIAFSVGGSPAETGTFRERLRANYTPLTGFCVMLFCLISSPCVATVAMTRQETGSWGWAAAQFLGLTVLAYAVTLVVYQSGRLFLA